MKKLVLIVSLLAMHANCLAVAEGTGVGNGNITRRNQYIEKLKKELSPTVTVQKEAKGQDALLSEWCSRVAAILNRELSVAMSLARRDQLELAQETLIDAMVTAAESIDINPNLARPITKTLLDRGLVLSQAIDDAVSNQSRLNLVTKLSFLVEYVTFIVRTTHDVDRPYYIPYMYSFNRCHGGCPSGFDMKYFERKYLGYARDQVAFIYTHLTEVGGNGRVFPVGNAKVYLKAAELVSAWVASDISRNLFAHEQACSAEELNVLSQSLFAYNNLNDRRVYANDAEALYLSRQALEAVAYNLGESVCRSPYHPY